MTRASRLILIEKLVSEKNITSQDELIRLMGGQGMKCTQATLSRDLRQLGISRGFDSKGGYRYMLRNRDDRAETLPDPETDAITGMTWAHSLLLINTPPGFASAVAIKIDRAGRYEIAGTVAGDDTILVIPRDNISNEAVEECLSLIFKHKMQTK